MDGPLSTGQRLLDATSTHIPCVDDHVDDQASLEHTLVWARIGDLLKAAPHRVVAEFGGRARLRADLTECVIRIGEIVAAEPLVIANALRGVTAGGKRLRPLFVLATAYAVLGGLDPRTRDRAVDSGVVVELLHLASLVHDDVMDESMTRHGAASVNARTGNIGAVLAGDFLLAEALCLGCDLGPAVGAVAARTFTRLCEGQAQESAALFDPDRTESAYFAAIAGKTGALFESACRLGAMAAGLSAGSTTALAEYGLRLGVAFQLVDDLLDISASAGALGKPVGHDIVEGVYTFPVLRAMPGNPRLRHVLQSADREDAARTALGIVRNSGALAATRHEIMRWSNKAAVALSAADGDLDEAGTAMLANLASTLVQPWATRL
jgi:geranylgeranyl pyrophosphate synthase